MRRITKKHSNYSTFQEASDISFSVVVPWDYTGRYALKRGESREELEPGARDRAEHEIEVALRSPANLRVLKVLSRTEASTSPSTTSRRRRSC